MVSMRMIVLCADMRWSDARYSHVLLPTPSCKLSYSVSCQPKEIYMKERTYCDVSPALVYDYKMSQQRLQNT